MELILKNVRMAFPALYEPRAMSNDPKSRPAYGAKYIIDPSSDNTKAISAAVDKVAEEKWPGKGAQILKQLREERKVCYVETAYKNKDGDVYDGFEDKFTLSTRSEKVKPTVKNRFNQTVIEGDVGAPYGGCVVHAAVDIWAQDDKTWGRRINAVTQGVMFASDGDPFSGGRPATDSTFEGMAAEPTVESLV